MKKWSISRETEFLLKLMEILEPCKHKSQENWYVYINIRQSRL